MKRLNHIAIGLAAMFALAAYAGEIKWGTITATPTAAGSVTAATGNALKISGAILEIKVVPASSETGNCSVVAIPADTDFASVTLFADAAIASETIVRPRFDGTDTAGAALTSDPPSPYVAAYDTLRLSVTNSSSSNVVYKALVKWVE